MDIINRISSNNTQLSRKSVIIVGNGSSLLEADGGSVIDLHDVVVRFNAFVIGSFAKQVGTKTNIWFCNRAADSPPVMSILKNHVFEQIYVHTWLNTPSAVQSFRNVLLHSEQQTSVTEVDKNVIAEMQNYGVVDYNLFSTGAIAVWIMLKYYEKVTLVGFDWWNKPGQFHYFRDGRKFKYPKDRGHQPQVEKAFFDQLVRENRLTFGLL